VTPAFIELRASSGHEQVDEHRHRVAHVQGDSNRRVDEQVERLLQWWFSAVLAHAILRNGPPMARPSLGNVPALRRRAPNAAAPTSTSPLARTAQSPKRTYGVSPLVVITVVVTTVLR